jgi:hypothetical protein
MKAVFFPFTFLTDSMVKACCRFFKKIVVIQATSDNIPRQMKIWQDAGLMNIRIPKPEDATISARLRDYRAWARDHQGGDISAFKYYKDTIPFFDDTSIAQIKKNIRTAETGERRTSASAGSDRLPQARLFLQMAQEFDSQNLDIVRNLAAHEEKQRVLFEGLRGEGGAAPNPAETEASFPADGPFGYMLSDRLSAWAQVMPALEIFDDLFITTSRETIELALSGLLETEFRIHMQKIPGFTGDADVLAGVQAAFMDHLKMLSRTAPLQFHEKSVPQFSVENGDENASMELYTISGMSPPDFFSRFLPKNAAAPWGKKQHPHVKNTIVGFIPPAGGAYEKKLKNA